MMDLLRDIANRVAGDMDRAFLSALTNNAAPPEPEAVTVEQMLAQIDRAIASLPPAPPRLVPAPWLVDRYEDWSRVRSRGRAKRRLRQGHRQNVVVAETPKTEAYRIGGDVFVHPVMLERARRAQP